MLAWNAVLEAANGLECQTRTDRPESWDFPAFFFSEPAQELFWRRSSERPLRHLRGWLGGPQPLQIEKVHLVLFLLLSTM